MDVLLNDEENSIKQVARDVLDGLATPGLARQAETDPLGYSAKLWREIAGLDWIGLCLQESSGGQGLPLHYAGLLLEEVGRFVAPVPLHSTMTVALAIDRYGTAEQRAQLLPRVTAGDLVLAVAHQEGRTLRPKGELATTARLDGGDYVLSGVKRYVDNAGSTGRLLVSAATEDGPALFLVDPELSGIDRTPLVTLAKDRQSTVSFDQVRVPATARLGTAGAAELDAVLDLGTALLCSQLAGATRRDMEFAVAHAKMREAFGRPIGAFQSIQHLAADMLIAVDGVELLTREALWRMGAGLPAAVEVSQAKAFANEKCVFVCRSSQQIHGGIGFMMEFDLHLWYRRVVAWTLRYGTVAEHRTRVAAALLDTPGPVRLGMTQTLPSA